jgi:hypothetical protein
MLAVSKEGAVVDVMQAALGRVKLALLASMANDELPCMAEVVCQPKRKSVGK